MSVMCKTDYSKTPLLRPPLKENGLFWGGLTIGLR